MPKGQYKYWVAESHDPKWDLDKLSDDKKAKIGFCIWKPEKLEHCSWHQHAYVELTENVGGKAINAVLGQEVRKKGDKGGYTQRNLARRGTQAQAIGYVVSDEWCRTCHTGDCNGAKWVFDEPYNLTPWVSEDHDECRRTVHKEFKNENGSVVHTKYKCELKGTCGEVQFFGTPAPQGKGSARKGGSGEICAEILHAIKSGASMHDIHDKYSSWTCAHAGWVKDMFTLWSVRPCPSQFSLKECCGMIKQHPVEFDHADWQHSVVVIGNAGIGKTEWALAHFERPLLVNHVDKLKSYHPDVYDGIVFDDIGFTHWPVEAQIHITDWTQDRDIHCRFFNGVIPKHTKKIFCCNWERFPFTRDDAVMDRLCVIETDKSLKSQRKKPPPRKEWVDSEEEPVHKKMKFEEIHSEGCYCQECVNRFLEPDNN